MGGKAALIVVIGFSVIIGFVVRSLSLVSTRAQGNMSTYAASAESHNIAVTGANVGLSRLYQDTTWRGTETQSLSGSFNGSFTYTIFNGADGRPILRSVSYVRGSNEILQDTVVVAFGSKSGQSFTLFAWMTNIEGNINFITGDTIWGRVHSNDKITINGSPCFVGKVTTVKGFNQNPGSGQNQAIFKSGYETGVAPLNFPTDLSMLSAAAGSGGRMYTGNVTVALKAGTTSDNDGYALVYSGSTLIDSVELDDGTFNGVLGATGQVSVSGTLDGKLTVFSTTQIYITDNLFYENRSSTSDDLLGLVSENNITIADNTANSSDVYIDGSVFARSGSFGAENYDKGSPRGHVYLNGSIVQNKRGAVGTFSGSTVKTGYLKAYRYDDRLADPAFRPPYYPGWVSISYPIASWWESVHIPKFQ
jgi:cytoskeletal protein CcmA (bactofilin family)